MFVMTKAWNFTIMIFGFIVMLSNPGYADLELKTGFEVWEPFQYKDIKGNHTGVDFDIVYAVAKQIKCNIEIVDMPWDRIIKSLKGGDIDFVAGASRKPEREQYAYFSDPYRQESYAMYIRKGEVEKYQLKKLIDIVGTKFQLGTVRGYFYGEVYEKLKKNQKVFKANIQEVVRDQQNFDKLLLNKTIDGFLIDPIVGQYSMKRQGIIKKVEKYPINVYSSDIFIMFSKESVDKKTVEIFNKGLQKIKASGELDAILKKYLSH